MKKILPIIFTSCSVLIASMKRCFSHWSVTYVTALMCFTLSLMCLRWACWQHAIHQKKISEYDVELWTQTSSVHVYFSLITNTSRYSLCRGSRAIFFMKCCSLNLLICNKEAICHLLLRIYLYVGFNLYKWQPIMIIALSYPDELFFKWLYTVLNLTV